MTDLETPSGADADRARMADLEAILLVSNTDVDEAIHVVEDNADAIFTWDYEKGARPALNKLYEKAKHSQWNGQTDLDWSIEVDQEEFAKAISEMRKAEFELNGVDFKNTPFENWGEKEWTQLSMETQNWSLSQFMHGEQGALLCTAKIVETVPWIDAKYYAATQVMDEARHVEVFAQYLDLKLNGHYPINAHLKALLDDIINDSRWDMTYLGMQIMVEGLALRYVMSDEARHVAFGVLSLKEFYDGLTDAEMLERQEFAFEAAIRMRNRFLQQEVWDRMGVDVKKALKLFDVPDEVKNQDPFQQLLFSKIVPNCKKLGLLDRNDKWLRHRFEEMGVIDFEDWEDTGTEYLKFELDAETPAPGASPAPA
jgi:hypothetical protein